MREPYFSYRNALVCSHDHLALFLTLVSGLEFIRFDLEMVGKHRRFQMATPECS